MNRQESKLSKEFVQELSRQSREFCIVGMTGKVRSGTSDVCALLTDPKFPSLMDLPASYQENHAREYRIIFRYLRENWKPFVEINVSSVIVSYLLELEPCDLEKFPGSLINNENPMGKSILDELNACANIEFFDGALKKAQDAGNNLLYKIDSANELSAKLGGACKKSIKNLDSGRVFFDLWRNVKPHLYYSKNATFDELDNPFFDDFFFCFGILPALEERLKKKFENDDRYPIMFQMFGNNIRATGCAVGISEKKQINSRNLFALPHRINLFMKLLRRYPGTTGESATDRASVYVVINNFKNIFEAYYFKRRYSAFYLMSVSCDEAMRRDKFNGHKNYLLTNLREDLSSGKKIYKSVMDAKRLNESIDFKSKEGLMAVQKAVSGVLDKDGATWEFIKQLLSLEEDLRKVSYEQNLAPFILQDVITCIENSDIFVTRDYKEPEFKYDQQLIRMIGRTVTLILHPGLLVPTAVERCMQVAMTAKLNSGCLSRQVGAVVTDSDYNILSLGWNDAPCGAESCLYRNFFDLTRKSDKSAYSEFELYNDEFRRYLDYARSELGPKMTELRGLPMAFCFKDIYQELIKNRDQIHTRALHGEERALAACDNMRAKGGYLFTTSSPCELCAKRAKDAKISKIYYIEQYPGISRPHITNLGPEITRAKYVPFVGAVGLAYTKLYTPLIPYKDELAALGFSPKEAYEQAAKESTSPAFNEFQSPPPDETGSSHQSTETNQTHQPSQATQPSQSVLPHQK